MTPYIKPIVVAVALSASFAAGWSWNGSRHDAEIANIRQADAAAALAAEQTARVKEQSLAKQLNEARNAATKRETQLRADAGRARNAADGLRDDLAAIRSSLPSLADDAVRQYADTAAELLSECSGDYQRMAEAADRHANEKQELIDAWPK